MEILFSICFGFLQVASIMSEPHTKQEQIKYQPSGFVLKDCCGHICK